jgi:ABC-type amino acid transport substrate-binding protein
VFVNESKSPPDNVTGFTVDIVRELAKRLDFDYAFVVQNGVCAPYIVILEC